MRELSIFIDESGDWGEYAKHCPYYIVTMVMHDQSKDIEKEIRHLEEHLPRNCLNIFENILIFLVPMMRSIDIP